MAQAPYGTWKSSITGEYLASRSSRLSETQWCGDQLFWLETRPQEKGRQTILCRSDHGIIQEILPTPWNARSKVHEYGGGCYWVTPESIYFVNGDDQQIYRLQRSSSVISQLSQSAHCRYADLFVDNDKRYLYAACEDHSDSKRLPRNRLERFDLHTNGIRQAEIIADGHDFVSNPRVSPCGNWLSYLSWEHPNMPWQTSQIWLRALTENNQIGAAYLLVGGDQESLFQPQWDPAGNFYWVSDISNWWNIKRLANAHLTQVSEQKHGSLVEDIAPMAAEFATPQWVFGMSTYGFLAADDLIATYTQNGSWYFGRWQLNQGHWQFQAITTECNSIGSVSAAEGKGAFIGTGVVQPTAVFALQAQYIKQVSQVQQEMCESDISQAQPVTIPGTTPTETAYGFYYSPRNSAYANSDNTAPPLIVIGHGGPTGACDPSFSYKIQYWTHRGFAVFDVNYRGSSGFGRHYRDSLNGLWGVADVEDLCRAARYAVAQKWAHPQQLIIRGSSAGGYSVLAALTDSDTFTAGVSLYGIGDLELLALDTHKFEAHYLDSLVGPYPAAKDLYYARSPLHKAAQIRCPLLVFQGELDAVVPPNQALDIVNTVRQQGLPVAYISYPDEGHGFRIGENICHQLESELSFYQTIFKLVSEPNISLAIANWPKAPEKGFAGKSSSEM